MTQSATQLPLLEDRPRLGLEVLIVLAISLGQSGVYSVLRIIERMTRGVQLNQQTSTLNSSVTPDRPATRRIGFDLTRPGFDAWFGTVIAACIGIPGLGLYLVAKALGINTQVQASGLTDHWWTIPVLVLAAAQNAVLEEVVMIGYLFTRLGQLHWRIPAIIVTSALVRGSYHLYQGWGGFAGNLIMGLVFGLIHLRWKRVMPLVVAHTLLDVAAFVGYSLLAPHVSWL